MNKPFLALLKAERPRHGHELLDWLAPGEAEPILRQAALTAAPHEHERFRQALASAVFASIRDG